MSQLRLHRILDYFDGPNIIEARDEIGGHYLGVWIAEGFPGDYVVFGISPSVLRQFRGGELDLLSVMENLPDGWMFANFDRVSSNVLETDGEASKMNIPNECLPLPGFYLSEGARHSAITSHEDEEVVLTGSLVDANRDTGRWELETSEGKRSGSRIEGGPSFSDMVIDRKYRFSCIERVNGTALGSERRVLILTAVTPLFGQDQGQRSHQ